MAPRDIKKHNEPTISKCEQIPTPNVAAKKHNPLTIVELVELLQAFNIASFFSKPSFLLDRQLVVRRIAQSIVAPNWIVPRTIGATKGKMEPLKYDKLIFINMANSIVVISSIGNEIDFKVNNIISSMQIIDEQLTFMKS